MLRPVYGWLYYYLEGKDITMYVQNQDMYIQNQDMYVQNQALNKGPMNTLSLHNIQNIKKHETYCEMDHSWHFRTDKVKYSTFFLGRIIKILIP